MSFDNQTPYQSNQLPKSIDFPIENKELKYLVTEAYSKIVSAVNTKIGGNYQPIETSTFGKFFIVELQQMQDIFRITIATGTLPDNTTLLVPHNLDVDEDFTLVNIYGSATDTNNLTFIPLPYSSPVLNENISLSMDQENVIITTGSTRSNYTQSYVVIEYTKG